MANFYKSAAAKLKGSPWVIAVFALSVWMIQIGMNFFIEDYYANVEVYNYVPTLKSNSDMAFSVANFFQFAPFLFGVWFLFDTNQGWRGIVSGGFLVADWMIGGYFRSNYFQMSGGWVAFAFAEDLVLYTVGSDVMLTMSIGLAWTTFGPAMSQTKKIFQDTGKWFTKEFGGKYQYTPSYKEKKVHKRPQQSNTKNPVYQPVSRRSVRRPASQHSSQLPADLGEPTYTPVYRDGVAHTQGVPQRNGGKAFFTSSKRNTTGRR